MKDFIAGAIMNLARDLQMRKEIIEEEGALSKIIAAFLKEHMNTQIKYATLVTLTLLCCSTPSYPTLVNEADGSEGEQPMEGSEDWDESAAATVAARKLVCGREALTGVMETLGSENSAFVIPALEILSHATLDEYTASQWPEVCDRLTCRPLFNICAFLQQQEQKDDESGSVNGVPLKLWATAVRLILVALGGAQAPDSPVPAAIGNDACLPGLISLLWRTTSPELQHDVLDAVAEVLRLCPAAKSGVLKDTNAMGVLLRMCNSAERERAVDATYALYYRNGRAFSTALNAVDFSPLLGLLQDHATDTPLQTINRAIIILSYMAHNSRTARGIMVKSVDCGVLLELINTSVIPGDTEKDEEQPFSEALPPPPPYSEFVMGVDEEKPIFTEGVPEEEEEEESNECEEDGSDDEEGETNFTKKEEGSDEEYDDDDDDEEEDDDDDDENEEDEEDDDDEKEDETNADEKLGEILEWRPKIIYNTLRFIEQLAQSEAFRRLEGITGNAEDWVTALEQILRRAPVPMPRCLSRTLGNVFTLFTTCPPVKEVIASRKTVVRAGLRLIRRPKRWERLLGLKILGATKNYAASIGRVFDRVLAPQHCPNAAKSEALRFISDASADVIAAYIGENPEKIAIACSFGLNAVNSHPEDTMSMITLCTKAAENGKSLHLLFKSPFLKIH